MASTFTPSNAVDMTKERDWPLNLGMLDWDSTSIVFTKRSLIEFLKYTGTTVDTNFNNIGKLPRYAKFGKLTEGVAAVEPPKESPNPSSTAPPARRTVPSRSITDLMATHDQPDNDALSMAPPPPAPAAQPTPPAPEPAPTPVAAPSNEFAGISIGSSDFKPTRRVRENPGGNSSLANFWDAEEPTEFKPTRRVREGPGGNDNINNIF